MNKKYILLILGIFAQASGFSQSTQPVRLTLEQCKKEAITNNIAIRNASHNIAIAKQQQKEAFTNYFPTLSATGFTFKSNKDMVKGNINTSEIIPSSLASNIPSEILSMIPSNIPVSLVHNGTLADITAIQPVFAGGQIVNGNKLAKVGFEASELQQKQSVDQVELNTEQYYWQIVTLKEKQKTLEALASMLQSIEKDVETAVKAGVTLRNDLLQVQLKQNEVQSNQIKVQNALKLCKMVLAQYIGRTDTNFDLTVNEGLANLPEFPFSLRQNHESVLINTSEYQLLQKNVEAASLQRKIEIGKYLPSVGLGAGYTYNKLLNNSNYFGIVFATVSVPISNWWGGSHAIKRKKIAELQAKEQLADNAQLLQIRMQKNWNDVDDSYKQLALAKKSIEQSEENLRLNRDFYHAGTVKMSDLLDAQQLYQQAHDQYVDAYSNFKIKVLEYRQSVGM